MARNTSSTTGPQWNHDVFVSFGEDDKGETFVLNLFKRLHQVGIGHFGEENIEGAEKIEANCPNALHEPTFAFALVVLSKNYVKSKPCLIQLVKILKCKRVRDLVVIPIFYMEREKVLNLARSDILEKGHRKALEEAEEMPGCDLKAANGERNLIDKIVGRLVNRIYSRYNEKFTFGPFGGEQNSRKRFKTKLIEEISEKGIKVEYGDFIKSVKFEVDKETSMIPKHGEKDGYRTYEVKLEDEEYITSFAGSEKNANGKYVLISSLTFRTNKRILGPIGRVKEEEEAEEEKKEEEGKKDESRGLLKRFQRKEEDEERQKKEEAEKKKKREKREKEEEEGYFSVPLDAGKVTEFYWREEGDFLDSVGALIQLHPKGINPFPSVGLFGRKCDREPMWEHTNVRKIVIHIGQKEEDRPDSSAAQKKKKEPSAKNEENRPSGGPFIRLIEFTCEDGGKPKTHGSKTGLDTKNFLTINLGAGEYLTSVSGYYTDNISQRYRDFGITSLTFRTNKQMAKTIGEEKGIYFSSPATAGEIVGFYGYNDERKNLCGIGAYFKPIPNLCPNKSIGPSGGSSRDTWDYRKFKDVRKIMVRHCDDNIHHIEFKYADGSDPDQVRCGRCNAGDSLKVSQELDYPREYLTSISGYLGKDGSISSIIFYSNKKRFDFGDENKGKNYFWYPLAGSRIIGLYESNASDYIGVHVEPIPHLYPFRTVGPPMKGSGGNPWNDGVHTNVRGFRVATIGHGKKEKIESITFMYDNNGSLVEGDQHGGGDASGEEWDMLDFPKERLLRIEGYMGKEGVQTIIHDLTIVSTRTSYLYAYRDDKTSSEPFFIPEKAEDDRFPGRIVGFFGRAGTHLNSVGARLEPY